MRFSLWALNKIFSYKVQANLHALYPHLKSLKKDTWSSIYKRLFPRIDIIRNNFDKHKQEIRFIGPYIARPSFSNSLFLYANIYAPSEVYIDIPELILNAEEVLGILTKVWFQDVGKTLLMGQTNDNVEWIKTVLPESEFFRLNNQIKELKTRGYDKLPYPFIDIEPLSLKVIRAHFSTSIENGREEEYMEFYLQRRVQLKYPQQKTIALSYNSVLKSKITDYNQLDWQIHIPRIEHITRLVLDRR